MCLYYKKSFSVSDLIIQLMTRAQSKDHGKHLKRFNLDFVMKIITYHQH